MAAIHEFYEVVSGKGGVKLRRNIGLHVLLKTRLRHTLGMPSASCVT